MADFVLPGTGRGTSDVGGGGGPRAVSDEESPLRQPFGLPPPRAGEDFSSAAGRLAGQAGVAFGWTPAAFWDATPAELMALVRALVGEDAVPPDGATIARMMEAFPDG